jgi:hypothetical protein
MISFILTAVKRIEFIMDGASNLGIREDYKELIQIELDVISSQAKEQDDEQQDEQPWS